MLALLLCAPLLCAQAEGEKPAPPAAEEVARVRDELEAALRSREQKALETALTAAKDAFRQSDAAWATRAELYGSLDQQLLNPGLAFGTLRRYSPEELATAARVLVEVVDVAHLREESTLGSVEASLTLNNACPVR